MSFKTAHYLIYFKLFVLESRTVAVFIGPEEMGNVHEAGNGGCHQPELE
jgi:hypothetical protein